MKEWLFEPIDTLFFRSGLPFNAGEGGTLESMFPPSPDTMQGVVRTAVLLRGNCPAPDIYGKGKCDIDCPSNLGGTCRIRNVIGTPGMGFGTMELYGPYVIKEGKRYYAVPLDVMIERENKKRLLTLAPQTAASPVGCDLGNVPLPQAPSGVDYGPFSAAEGWISEDDLREYLESGSISESAKLLPLQDDGVRESLYAAEPRVGIGRDGATRTVKTGMLYSISPIRLKPGVKLGLKVAGVDMLPASLTCRLGGEARVSSVTVKDARQMPVKALSANDIRIRLVLLQPADFDSSWLPGWCNENSLRGVTSWQGEWQGVTLKLVSACVGKAQKVGGFDMANNCMKSMVSCVPAGSVYYFEVVGGDISALAVEGKIGNRTEIGYGHYILGRW